MEEKSLKLAALAEMVNGELLGDPETVIRGLADPATAGSDDIIFATKAPDFATAGIRAAAIILPLSVKESPLPAIRVKNPYLAAAIIHSYFLEQPFAATGISPRAHIGADCSIPAETSIGPMVVLGNRVSLGKRVTLKPGVVLGDEVSVGDDCLLHANVSVSDRCLIGARVIIHSGTVVGSDGFGFAADENGRHHKRPHVGIVQIDDDVELGSNVSIDRGTFGKTWIKSGVKVDNLVQIAHNAVVGENSLLVAQCGVAGSASLGRNVVLGGQVGVIGHIHLQDRVMVAGQSGVTNGDAPAGTVISGTPAIPHRQWLKASAIFARLPQLAQEISELKQKLAGLAAKEKAEPAAK